MDGEPEEEDPIECQIIDACQEWCEGKKDYDDLYCQVTYLLDLDHQMRCKHDDRRRVYVEPRDERFSVRLEGNKRASYLVGLQDTAIKLGREMAMNHGYELVVLR